MKTPKFSYLQYLKAGKWPIKDPDWVMRVPYTKSQNVFVSRFRDGKIFAFLVPEGIAMRNDMLWTMLSILVSYFRKFRYSQNQQMYRRQKYE